MDNAGMIISQLDKRITELRDDLKQLDKQLDNAINQIFSINEKIKMLKDEIEVINVKIGKEMDIVHTKIRSMPEACTSEQVDKKIDEALNVKALKLKLWIFTTAGGIILFLILQLEKVVKLLKALFSI